MKITINLFNTGSATNKAHVEIISCNKSNVCSFCKNNKCIGIKTIFGNRCQFAKVEYVTGYTNRSSKYFDFISKYKHDPLYQKLIKPSGWRFGIIDDTYVLNLVYAQVDHKVYNGFEWKESKSLNVFSTGWGETYSYIDKDELTPDILKKICEFAPVTLSNDLRAEYTTKIIPNLLYEIKLAVPDLYNNFIEQYPKFNELEPNFVGKYAYVNSFKDGTIFEVNGSHFAKENGKLICKDYNSKLTIFDTTPELIVVPILEDTIYQIKDNSIVDENVIFKD